MEDRILNSIPKSLQERIYALTKLSQKGWSDKWHKTAMEILFDLNEIKSQKLITDAEWKHIHKKYLKSIGIIGGTETTFFNFLISSKMFQND